MNALASVNAEIIVLRARLDRMENVGRRGQGWGGMWVRTATWAREVAQIEERLAEAERDREYLRRERW